MKTLLKWPGGKEKELPIIREHIPTFTGRYVEPFVGAGAVFFDVSTNKYCINDKSSELINFYNCIKQNSSVFKKTIYTFANEFSLLSKFADENSSQLLDLYFSKISVESFVNKYYDNFSKIAQYNNEIFISELKRNLNGKIKRSGRLEYEIGNISNIDRLDNIEAAIKSAYYMYIRYLYNQIEKFDTGIQAAIFFMIREYCYSSMFRYNSDGEFNVPYGGISYNRKDIIKKIDYLFSPEVSHKIKESNISNADFEDFINSLKLTENDFMFLDPPYDTDFSTYSKNIFGQKEQIRLRECLKKTKAKILLVIKNTDFIFNLYKNDFNVSSFDKKYLVSFMNRNNKAVKHLIIKNY